MLLGRKEDPPAEDDYLVYNYNRFQACRFGLDGSLVHPRTGETISLREDILATLRCIEPDAIVLDSQAALEEVRAIAGGVGNDASFLRRCYAREGGLESVVESAIDSFHKGR